MPRLLMCALALLSPLSALYYEGPLPGLVALAFLGLFLLGWRLLARFVTR